MLKQKILDRNIRFGVIGLGYVGLPLAVEFAKAGMRVTGFEVDARKVEKLSLGESYIGDVPSTEVAPLVKRGSLSATTDFDELAQMDVVSICVPTPLSKTRDPDMSFVVQATEEVRRRLRKGQLIILESTTYPGTTDELMKVELEKTGLKCGTSSSRSARSASTRATRSTASRTRRSSWAAWTRRRASSPTSSTARRSTRSSGSPAPRRPR